MWVVVGLGNPGSAYASTRHNVGFVVVEELATALAHSICTMPTAVRGSVRASSMASRSMLVEPQLYMNRSGPALTAVRPPLTAHAMIVVHDDLDLECRSSSSQTRRRNGWASWRGVGRRALRLRVYPRSPRHRSPTDTVRRSQRMSCRRSDRKNIPSSLPPCSAPPMLSVHRASGGRGCNESVQRAR